MPELGQITRVKPATATVDLGDGDVLNVEFDRNKVTPAWTKTLIDMGSSDPLAIPKTLAEAIIGWDVTSDGQPFPPTADNIAVLSFDAQQALMVALQEASVPKEQEGKVSPAPTNTPPSTSTPQPQKSRNGQETSSSLVPSAFPSQT